MGPNHNSGVSQPPPTGKNQAIAALVAGIVGVAVFSVPDIGVLGDVIGIVLGAMYRHRPEGEYRGIATAGFVMGIIGVCLSILYFLFNFMLTLTRN